MNKAVLALQLFLLLHCNIFAQESVKFNRYYQTSNEINEIRDVISVNNSYFLFGVDMDSTTNTLGILKIKVDSLGNFLDRKIYASSTRNLYHDNVNSTIKEPDGGFVLTGGTTSAAGKGFYLMKFNGDGDSLWFQVYDEDSLADLSYNLCNAFDTGYIVTGGQIINNSEDLFVANVDSAGNVLWKTLVGGPQINLDYGVSITRTWDSCYIAAGLTKSYTGHEKWFAVKINRQGSVLWKHWYGENNTANDGPCRVVELSDSSYIMYGWRGNPTNTFTQGRVKKFNKNFVETQSQNYGAYSNSSHIGTCFANLPDGRIIAVGGTYVPEISHYRYALYNLKSNLDSNWRREYILYDPELPADYDYVGNKGFRDIDICTDGGFIIAGFYVLNGEKRIWLLKTDSLGCDGTYDCDSLLNTWPSSVVETPVVSLYPNPANKLLRVDYAVPAKTNISVKIYNTLGQQVYSKNNLPALGQLPIDVSHFNEGVYFIDFGNQFRQKFSLVH